MYRYIMGLCLLLVSVSHTLASESAIQLLKKADELYRSESSSALMVMHVVTPNWQRSMTLQSWSKGLDDTFIRILSPKKDKGVATLKMGKEMWNFFPKINKVIKVPPSMMMGSWMGSDFTNDDLVREVSLVEDYDVNLKSGEGVYTLTLHPKKETVTVWESIQIDIQKETTLPVEQRYYNEKGMLVRTMGFDKVKALSGRNIPTRMTMTPHNKVGHSTVVEYQDIIFDQPLPDDVFSLRHLQQRFK